MIDFQDRNISKIGNIENPKSAKIYNNEVFYSAYNTSTKNHSLHVINIKNNFTEDIYETDVLIDALAIGKDYLVWRLRNGTFVYQDRDTGERKYFIVNNGFISWFSANNEYIVYSDYDRHEHNEIYLLNLTTKAEKRLTKTYLKSEYYSVINGNYIVWISTHEMGYIEWLFFYHGSAIMGFCCISIIGLGIIVAAVFLIRRQRERRKQKTDAFYPYYGLQPPPPPQSPPPPP